MKTQNRFKLIISIIFLFLYFLGCNKTKDQNPINEFGNNPKDNRHFELSDLSVPPGIEEKKLINENTIVPENKRMIIRTGTMNIEVESYNDAEKKISDAVNKFSGYITNTSSNLNASGKKQGSISVRVPSEKFDAFISEISALGKVMSQNISGNDVTEEYIDLEARQKTQRELERRLLELLSEKTAKLIDIVEVEQKLSNVRENIERTEGRMKFLRDQSVYSTLTVSLFEPSLLQTSSGGGFFYEISEGFKRGLKGFTDVLSWLITLVISFSPVLVLLGIVLFLLRRILRNKSKFASSKLNIN